MRSLILHGCARDSRRLIPSRRVGQRAVHADPTLQTRRTFLAACAGLGLPIALLARPPHIVADEPATDEFQPIDIPRWVLDVTRMAFVTPGDVDKAAGVGVQVVHGNAVWPYYPLQRDGGGLRPDEDRLLRQFVDDCHRHEMKLVLGLPPFPPVELVQKHPDWRVHPDDSGTVLKLVPTEKDLGTRLGCNLGPWGDYLIDVCCELVKDYHVDGFSFDGNYHPPICYCPACKEAYRSDKRSELPARATLNDIPYRKYVVWRGERLEQHYRRMQRRLKSINPDAALMSWSVNAGRYGHFLHLPRVMPTRLNLLFDLPMQEWWLDETNFGASVAPAFGAAYLRAVTGDRPNASEAYLMSRGNPYGTDSFPKHERRTRNLLAMTNGSITAESFGWPIPLDSTEAVFEQVAQRDRWLTHTRRLAWAAQLVSEQTRHFYAYGDVPERFLAHQFGAFRCGYEEHLPLSLINDWDVTTDAFAPYAVLLLPNAAALSDEQANAVREYVHSGGGLVASAETSLFDELGQPRGDFALADVLGVTYDGRPQAPLKRAQLDANFAVTVDERYWKDRTGLARLAWNEHPLVNDERLQELVPRRSVAFRGPLVRVGPRTDEAQVVATMMPEGAAGEPMPAIVARSFGRGKVVYLAAAIDAALWSYAYPYQRRLLARSLEWAAREPPPLEVKAPLCVQATYFLQSDQAGKRLIVQFFNGINTAANHGLPSADVPLREETVPIHGIKAAFREPAPKSFHVEPGYRQLQPFVDGGRVIVELPPLELHCMLVAEY
ncbi:MAG TPA: alpha-amylase family protein [Pirellulales bacterium]|nr:alpha-amylase family protein [Pirellulales bacterium]